MSLMLIDMKIKNTHKKTKKRCKILVCVAITQEHETSAFGLSRLAYQYYEPFI